MEVAGFITNMTFVTMRAVHKRCPIAELFLNLIIKTGDGYEIRAKENIPYNRFVHCQCFSVLFSSPYFIITVG